MEENPIATKTKLLPKEERLLTYYFQGLKYYLCAKLAGYQLKSQSALSRKTKQIVKKYVSQVSKEDISQRAEGHVAAWWRDLQWTKKQAKAKRDLKNMVAVLKMQGEAIGVLKAKEMEGETGATIIINTDGKAQKEPAKKVKQERARVVSLAGSDD